MHPLIQRMIEDMQLRDLSENTQEAYARAVRQLTDYWDKAPDQISETELRDYFLLDFIQVWKKYRQKRKGKVSWSQL